MDAGDGLGTIPIKQGASFGELPSQGLDQVFRKKGMAIFSALPIADGDGAAFKVQVLDSQRQHFCEAHAGAIQETRHEERQAFELGEKGSDLLLGQNDRKAFGALGRLELRQVSDRNVQNVLVEEDKGVERLVLGGGGDVPLHGEVFEEGRVSGLVTGKKYAFRIRAVGPNDIESPWSAEAISLAQ